MSAKRGKIKIFIGCVLVIVLIVFGLYVVLRERMYLTAQEVTQQLEQELPMGTSLEKTLKFAHSYDTRFNTFVGPYRTIAAMRGTTAADEAPATATNYFTAVIRNTGSAPTQLITWNIYMHFYFDERSNLMAYKVQTIGDGL